MTAKRPNLSMLLSIQNGILKMVSGPAAKKQRVDHIEAVPTAATKPTPDLPDSSALDDIPEDDTREVELDDDNDVSSKKKNKLPPPTRVLVEVAELTELIQKNT